MMSTFRHPEAFRLLRYRCQTCGFVEVVWNSRDGTVPQVIDCAASLTTCVYQHGGDPAYVESVNSWFRLVAVGHDPAMVSSRCGGAAHLINWPGAPTYFAYDHDPLPGERYFRDGIPAEARAIMRTRLERMRAGPDGHLIRAEDIARLVRAAGGGEPYPDPRGPGSDEFVPSWPMVVVRGTDADGLPMQASGAARVGR